MDKQNRKFFRMVGIVGVIIFMFLVIKSPNANASINPCGVSPNISGLTLYLPFNNVAINGENSKIVHDFSGNNLNGIVVNATWNASDGYFKDGAYQFNGNSYIEIPDNSKLSPSNYNEQITVSFWIKPATFNFKGESQGYVNYLGKGTPNQHEYTFRLYNYTAMDSVLRDRRVSFYAFNLVGGQGAGSYFQDSLNENQWVHITGVINGTVTKIYKNGVLRDTDLLSGYNIVMGDGTAPLRIGTRDFNSFFQGSIDEVKIYNRALSDSEIAQLYGVNSCSY